MPLPLLIKVVGAFTMPVLGILAYDYYNGLKIFLASVRLRIGLARNDQSYVRFQHLRLKILQQVKELIP